MRRCEGGLNRYNFDYIAICLCRGFCMVHMAVHKRKESTRLYQETHTDDRVMDYFDFSYDCDAKNNYSDCVVV